MVLLRTETAKAAKSAPGCFVWSDTTSPLVLNLRVSMRAIMPGVTVRFLLERALQRRPLLLSSSSSEVVVPLEALSLPLPSFFFLLDFFFFFWELEPRRLLPSDFLAFDRERPAAAICWARI